MTTVSYNIGGAISATQLTVSGTGGGGYVNLINQSSAPSAIAGSLNLYSDNSGQLARMGADGFTRTFADSNTASRTYTFPDVSGTFQTDTSSAVFSNKSITGGSSGNTVSANQLLGITVSGTPTNGQVLTYSSIGPSWSPANPTGGGSGTQSSQVWVIKDIKSIGTNGGIFTANSWITRTLNTLSGSGLNCSLGSNQITLAAGTYLIQAKVPAVNVGYHACKLYSITGAADIAFGTVIQGGNIFEASYSFLDAIVTIVGTTVYEIRHRSTIGSTDKTGLGISSGFMSSETYTTVTIMQLN